ncbi:gas vesicle protein GvpO [Streptomyces sp. VRA16 Mangrove soil]|uniref:gas vesicle protein GvpO n=1 Tax=Streptomyces sp. VRA16 Mangrove soil TaxID=2817434 RepID=UPI001A9EE3FD|nr:gas vesicle protein GvpO [Streptomyces sp. VRA16 Mangrove soil]MBO1330263.1 gas vesicle protein [Streptomyces sp. VRA16 Mangrove soil]
MNATDSGRPSKAPGAKTSTAQDRETTDRNRTSDEGRESAASRPRRPKRLRPAEAIRQGREQLMELTGKEVDSVSSFSATDDGGWQLDVEVLELSRIPDTMSLLASYAVTLDSDGVLTDYRRVRRYERGRSDDRS